MKSFQHIIIFAAGRRRNNTQLRWFWRQTSCGFGGDGGGDNYWPVWQT